MRVRHIKMQNTIPFCFYNLMLNVLIIFVFSSDFENSVDLLIV